MAQITRKGFVVGIYFSEAMFAQAGKVNKQYTATKRVKNQKGNCKDLPYRHELFDKVCTSNPIYFFEDPIRQLSGDIPSVKARRETRSRI